MTDPKSIRAIDAVVNIWTEEALSHRPDWGDDFFVGKMKAKSNIMPGLALAEMIEHERETYEQWLGMPDEILQLLEENFEPVQQETKWGKLYFQGQKNLQITA